MEDLSGFPLSDEEWYALYQEARRQTVMGWVYQGVTMLPEDLLPPDALMMKWVAEVESLALRNSKMNRAISELFTLFCDRAILPVLLKGQGLAALYLQPELRECGDIDLYFPLKTSRTKAEGILHDLGVALEKKADGSTCYQWRGMEVEHHSHLTDICNPFMKGELEKLECMWGTKDLHDCEELITVPNATGNLLLLQSHILKHSLSWGVGLRQLCDMAMAYKHLHDKADHDLLDRLNRKAGTTKWVKLLNSFLVQYLDVPTEWLRQSEWVDATPLLDRIMRGGNFGFHRGDAERDSQSAFKRKLQTVRAFAQNIPYAWKYARKEACWTVWALCVGGVKALRARSC